MIAPEGYVPVSEVNAEYAILHGATSDSFSEALRAHRVFTSDGNKVQTIDARLLSQVDGEHLFVNPRDWSISILHPFKTGVWSATVEVPENCPPQDYREYEIKAQFISLIDQHKGRGGGALDQFIRDVGQISPEAVLALRPLEGRWLLLKEDDARTLREDLKAVAKNLAMTKRPLSAKELERQWDARVNSFNESNYPKLAQDLEWGRERGASRDKIRDFRERRAPKWWTKPGRRTNSRG
ncbi:hypothetical protein [uncultured Roseobacter sp.]|uniref:hypothetical protein n=1 Tax=uncultured Roseobacter sp. TaxID=114847 RepID=UPI00262747E4|nr:hypothetical protein [uncultured Roseobacter sp.]